MDTATSHVRLLLVDDNAAAREILVESLDSLAERVDAVSSGGEALAAIRERSGDIPALARHLLTTPPLYGTATLLAAEPPDVGWTFRRHSCCLYHRVPGGGLCGDCVLVDRRPRAG